MNTYNQKVLDEYCRLVSYTVQQKQELTARLEKSYGDKLNSKDVLFFMECNLVVKATLTSIQ